MLESSAHSTSTSLTQLGNKNGNNGSKTLATSHNIHTNSNVPRNFRIESICCICSLFYFHFSFSFAQRFRHRYARNATKRKIVKCDAAKIVSNFFESLCVSTKRAYNLIARSAPRQIQAFFYFNFALVVCVLSQLNGFPRHAIFVSVLFTVTKMNSLLRPGYKSIVCYTCVCAISISETTFRNGKIATTTSEMI